MNGPSHVIRVIFVDEYWSHDKRKHVIPIEGREHVAHHQCWCRPTRNESDGVWGHTASYEPYL